jgi:hypothetical protein
MLTQRSDRERLDAPGMAGGCIAPGEALGVDLYRPLDWNAAPVGDRDPRCEVRRRVPRYEAGNGVSPHPLLIEILFDPERQESKLPLVRHRQPVERVEIPNRVKDRQHLGVKDAIRRQGARVRMLQSSAHDPQPLDRIDRVHRYLERQMHVVLLEQKQRLLDDELPLGQVQFGLLVRLPQKVG